MVPRKLATSVDSLAGTMAAAALATNRAQAQASCHGRGPVMEGDAAGLRVWARGRVLQPQAGASSSTSTSGASLLSMAAAWRAAVHRRTGWARGKKQRAGGGRRKKEGKKKISAGHDCARSERAAVTGRTALQMTAVAVLSLAEAGAIETRQSREGARSEIAGVVRER
ncbi:hypothetical protein BS50DRAFT_372475 [Corynespora cassiicola Philippines]|uniref:Uncharacterized protein n=1 Tax=Corynespora cassiicola Philippines TaxID=1448308 RepID=A0A2T2NMY3_CORCC|nr:hypothetical protein BS50DRAFT_372475 [Corynespora cassiicola Philippines]